jgi:hypothetical protein
MASQVALQLDAGASLVKAHSLTAWAPYLFTGRACDGEGLVATRVVTAPKVGPKGDDRAGEHKLYSKEKLTC